MKELVILPDDLIRQTERQKEYFDLNFEYISSIKPKPNKK